MSSGIHPRQEDKGKDNEFVPDTWHVPGTLYVPGKLYVLYLIRFMYLICFMCLTLIPSILNVPGSCTWYLVRTWYLDVPGILMYLIYGMYLVYCMYLVILWGFAKTGYTSLFLRQKGAYLKNVWTIYNKHRMISACSPFWRKNTGEYPPVSIQLNKCPFLAVEIAPFWRMHEIISERAVHPGSTTLLRFSR